MTTHQPGSTHQPPGNPPRPGTPQCREALETLYHFLDGELTEQRRRDIQQHLDECSPCLEAFDFEAELKLVVARHCRDRVPEQLRLRVVMALAEASREDVVSE
ncbi:MAG: mycothiol system anti-sigma-R factor [Acidimicrobiales bacterium]